MYNRFTRKWWDTEDTLPARIVRHYGGRIVYAADILGVSPTSIARWRFCPVLPRLMDKLVEDSVCTEEEFKAWQPKRKPVTLKQLRMRRMYAKHYYQTRKEKADA